MMDMGSDWERDGPWLEGRRNGWIYRAMIGVDDAPSGFIDVHALGPSGEHLVGTICTISAIQERLRYFENSGECLGGQYFWAAGLVVVASMDRGVLLTVLDDLARQGDLKSAFEDTALDTE